MTASDTPPRSADRVTSIGFVPVSIRGSAAYPPPRLLKASRARPLGRRAVQACPAVTAFERRTIELLAPFSLGLRCLRNHRGGHDLHLIEENTRPDDDIVDAYVTLMPRHTWRDERRPVVQIGYPFFFIADETCFLTQMPAWPCAAHVAYPGPFIGGRFPTHSWPRSLNISFEWEALDKPFRMKRGQPISCLSVETAEPDMHVRLVAARMTDALAEYRARMDDVVKVTSATFDLIPELERLRPATLLEEMRA